MTAAHPAASHNGSDAARWRLIGKPSSGWPATTAARSRWPAQASRGHTRRHTICPTAPGTGLKNTSESIKAFSEADFTSDLQRFDVPTLVIHGEHGEHDQIVPVKDPARNSARLIKGANKVYHTGPPHGHGHGHGHGHDHDHDHDHDHITATLQGQVNADPLAFLGGWPDLDLPAPGCRREPGPDMAR